MSELAKLIMSSGEENTVLVGDSEKEWMVGNETGRNGLSNRTRSNSDVQGSRCRGDDTLLVDLKEEGDNLNQ